MKAAVFHAPHQPLTIEEVAVNKPGPREVLLRTAFAGLCHSDLHFIEGLYPIPTPVVLGHESSAIVEAVGDGVTYVKPGDHVITCLCVFCGTCPQCLTGHSNLCENTDVKMLPGVAKRMSWNGEQLNQAFNLSSFAEQMLVHENSMVKIDDDIPLDRAALVGCGVMTGVGAVFNAAKVEPGSTVAVIGCGGVGLSAVNGAALAGAERIIAIDTVAVKARTGARTRRHRHAQRQQCRPGQGGARHDRRRRPLLVRGARHQSNRRAGVSDAARRRHRDDHRHGAVWREDRIARLRFPARPQDPGHLDGRQPLSGRHAAAVVIVAPRPAQARPPDLRHASNLGEINDGFAKLKSGAPVRQLIDFATT